MARVGCVDKSKGAAPNISVLVGSSPCEAAACCSCCAASLHGPLARKCRMRKCSSFSNPPPDCKTQWNWVTTKRQHREGE